MDPEELGFSPERLGRIGPVVQGYIDKEKLAGVVTLVARRGSVAHLGCFGMMDVHAGKPMQADTIFRVRSLTKPITAAAVLALYEEGRFQLYDPISEYIPQLGDLKVLVDTGGDGKLLVDANRQITIDHLLTHTSVLSYGFFNDPVDELYRESLAEHSGPGQTGRFRNTF